MMGVSILRTNYKFKTSLKEKNTTFYTLELATISSRIIPSSLEFQACAPVKRRNEAVR